MTAQTEGFVTVDSDVSLFYQTVGSGDQTVLVPNGFHLLADFGPLTEQRTLVYYDVRNRGRSNRVDDDTKLARGILQDADDLDVVRRHFAVDTVDVVAHSYIGVAAAVYAMTYPAHCGRVLMIGPSPPSAAKEYPPHLSGADATRADVLARLARFQRDASHLDPVERCRQFWSILRFLYVVNPADADRINWFRCDLPNESNLMKYWMEHLIPSLQRLALRPDDFARARMPILIVHGTRDRSAPYGGARDWATLLPNARLLTVDDAGHAPWIEAPDLVFSAIETFLRGAWPGAAR